MKNTIREKGDTVHIHSGQSQANVHTLKLSWRAKDCLGYTTVM